MHGAALVSRRPRIALEQTDVARSRATNHCSSAHRRVTPVSARLRAEEAARGSLARLSELEKQCLASLVSPVCHGAPRPGSGRLSELVAVLPGETIEERGADARLRTIEKVRNGQFYGKRGHAAVQLRVAL